MYSNPGTQVGAQNKDFGAVSETDVTRVKFRLWRRLYQMWQMFSYLFSLSTGVVAFLDNLLLYIKNSIDKQDSTVARQIAEASGIDNQSLSASGKSNKSIKQPAACSNTGAHLGSVRTVAETVTVTITTPLVRLISSPSVALGNVTVSVSF